MKCLKTTLVNEYRILVLLAMTIFSSGCASSPLFQEWDWSIRPDRSKKNLETQTRMLALEERMKEIYKEHPNWKNMADSDTFFVETYDANGVKIGSSVITK